MSEYPTSTITIYNKNCKIRAEKNFRVDDIDDYLSSLTGTTTIEDFQFIKHQLALSIKISREQDNVFESDSLLPCYVKIKNDVDSKSFYYFVVSYEWKSSNTLLINLEMDTINSFWSEILSTIDNKTMVYRQHENRFSSRVDEDGITYFKNKIDFNSEGINPQLFKRQVETIRQTGIDYDFYLLYRNQNDPSETLINPVDCFLIPGHSISAIQEASEIESGSVLANGLPAFPASLSSYRRTLYISKNDNPSNYFGITYNGAQIGNFNDTNYFCFELYPAYTSTSPALQYWAFRIYKASESTSGFISWTEIFTQYDKKDIGFLAIEYLSMFRFQDNSTSYQPAKQTFGTAIENISDFYQFTGEVILNPLSEFDRTDPKFIKLIKLPYCPDLVTSANGVINLDLNAWNNSTSAFSGKNVMKLVDLNHQFQNEILYSSDIISNATTTTFDTLDIGRNVERSIVDPKLFHSDYYQPTFFYDSFQLVIHLEYLNTSASAYPYLKNTNYDGFIHVIFNPTTTINSKMLFTIDKLDLSFDTQNYSNIIAISRNNEMPLYSNAYVTYVRTGFNYDIKAKNRGVASTVVSTGVSLASNITSMASIGGAIFETDGGIAKATAQGGSIISSITGAVNSILAGEEAIQRKQVELQNQTTSVSGSDDVDLVSIYSKNRLSLGLYKCSSLMSDILDDLFYYTGYIQNRKMIPTFDSRAFFNFVQCVPEFKNQFYYQNIIDDVSERFKIGVTILHKFTNGVVHPIWDFEQFYENWENSLF